MNLDVADAPKLDEMFRVKLADVVVEQDVGDTMHLVVIEHVGEFGGSHLCFSMQEFLGFICELGTQKHGKSSIMVCHDFAFGNTIVLRCVGHCEFNSDGAFLAQICQFAVFGCVVAMEIFHCFALACQGVEKLLDRFCNVVFCFKVGHPGFA